MDKSIFNFQPAGKKSILLSGTKREKYKNSFEMTGKMLVGKQSELGKLGNKCELGNTEYNKESHITHICNEQVKVIDNSTMYCKGSEETVFS